MTEIELKKRLNSGRISMMERDELVDEILSNPKLTGPLLGMVHDEDNTENWWCSWVFDHVMRKHLRLILPHIDTFCNGLRTLKSESVIRPMAHTCELLALAIYRKKQPLFVEKVSMAHREELTERCFDWLIEPHKMAPKVFAMTALLYLGEDFDWVRPELKLFLEKNFRRRKCWIPKPESKSA